MLGQSRRKFRKIERNDYRQRHQHLLLLIIPAPKVEEVIVPTIQIPTKQDVNKVQKALLSKIMTGAVVDVVNVVQVVGTNVKVVEYHSSK